MKGLVSIVSRPIQGGVFSTRIRAASAETLDAMLSGMAGVVAKRNEANGRHEAVVVSRHRFDRIGGNAA